MGKKKREKQLLGMFEERRALFEASSQDIFAHLSNLTEAAERRIHEQPGLDNGVVRWEYIAHHPELNAVVMDVRVEFPVGTEITTQSGTATVTEEIKGYFDKTITIAIPVKVAILKTAEAIYDAIGEAKDTEEVEEVAELHKLTKKKKKTPQPTDDTLSEKDAKRLLLSARNPTGIKH